MPLQPSEISLVDEVGFDRKAADLFKDATKSQLNRFTDVDGKLIGIAARIADGHAAEKILDTRQSALIQHGYRAFWTALHESNGRKMGDALLLLRSTDHFAILDAIQPCAESHSGPEVIYDRLKSYEKLCDLEIVGASHDWVAVKFKSLPENLCSFAEDIYLFCPDSCDLSSGIGSKGKYTSEVRAAAQALCPVVSKNFRQLLKAKYSGGPAADVFPAEFFDMLLQDAERNVRLVAWNLKQEMYFYFWWD